MSAPPSSKKDDDAPPAFDAGISLPPYYNNNHAQNSPAGAEPYYNNTYSLATGAEQQQPRVNNDMTAFGGARPHELLTTRDVDYSYITPLHNVVDLIPPIPMNTPIAQGITRSWLSHQQGREYNKELWHQENLHSNSPRCCDFMSSSWGPAALITAVLGGIFFPFAPIASIILWSFSGFFALMYLVLVLCISIYTTSWLCCCCYTSTQQFDQPTLTHPYHTTVYRHRKSQPTNEDARCAMEKITKCIEQISTDIPSIRYHIVASHQSGSGKHRHTVVTYSKTHYIPILHSKFVGPNAQTFLNYLEDNATGDTIVSYQPEFHFHPAQQDYLVKLSHAMHHANKDRDATVNVYLRLVTHSEKQHRAITTAEHEMNPQALAEAKKSNDNDAVAIDLINVPGISGNSLQVHSLVPNDDTSSEGEHDYFANKHNNTTTMSNHTSSKKGPKKDESMANLIKSAEITNGVVERKLVPEHSSLSCASSTSVGAHTDLYFKQHHGVIQDPHPVLQCITHPFVWTISMFMCLAPFLFCCWHKRYSQGIYKAEHYVILPNIHEIMHAHQQHAKLFALESDGPVQPRLQYVGQPPASQ